MLKCTKRLQHTLRFNLSSAVKVQMVALKKLKWGYLKICLQIIHLGCNSPPPPPPPNLAMFGEG